MVTFRNNNNNNRRSQFRNNNRRPSFRRNDEGSKFSNNDNFQRKVPGRNNHNASKLIEKYNDLAREALAHEDKILSENYFQHADHFTRVQNEQEINRISRIKHSPTEATKIKNDVNAQENLKEKVVTTEKKLESNTDINNKKVSEKKTAAN
jgi:hypothetical protein